VSAAPFTDELRESALSLASSGAWSELCTLFVAQPPDPALAAPEMANLRTEALLRSGRPRDARDWMVAALPVIEQRNDRAAVRQAVNLLGAANFELGELTEAATSFQRALDLGHLDHDDLLVARATNNLGAIANIRSEREQALAMYTLAVAAYQKLGQPRGLAVAYHNMAITFRHIGLLERADECECRAIEFAREAQNGHLLLLARIGRAEISLLSGDARFAEASAMFVAREFAQRGDPIQEAHALRVAGAARIALGDYDGAALVLEDGLRVAVDSGAALIQAELLRTRAQLHVWRSRREAAIDDARRAIAIFDRLNAAADRESLACWLANLEAQTPPVES
jgi:tetratricopeptide (TPR) repeat protein